jgi:hypothetical protein
LLFVYVCTQFHHLNSPKTTHLVAPCLDFWNRSAPNLIYCTMEINYKFREVAASTRYDLTNSSSRLETARCKQQQQTWDRSVQTVAHSRSKNQSTELLDLKWCKPEQLGAVRRTEYRKFHFTVTIGYCVCLHK